MYMLFPSILLAPFVSCISHSRYIIVCQGQLEGEGKVTLIFIGFFFLSSLFSFSCYSCNIFEVFRWSSFPFSSLRNRFKFLPWFGVCLNPQKLLTYRNTYSASRFLPVDRKIVVGYLGRICDSKGVFDLIRLFSLSQFSDYELVLCGPIENTAQSSHTFSSTLASNISFHPPISSDKVHHWYQSVDIFITFSRGESIGASTVEALLSGLPVISLVNSGACQV